MRFQLLYMSTTWNHYSAFRTNLQRNIGTGAAHLLRQWNDGDTFEFCDLFNSLSDMHKSQTSPCLPERQYPLNRKRETIACHFKNLGIAKHLIMWNTRNTLTQGVLPGRQEDIRERAFYASGPLSKILAISGFDRSKKLSLSGGFLPSGFRRKDRTLFSNKKVLLFRNTILQKELSDLKN